MNTTIVQGQNQPIQQSSFNQSQYMDLFINNMIISKFGDVMKEDFNFNMKNIGKIVLLMSISEIKNIVTSIFTSSIEYIKKSPQIGYMYLLFLSLFKTKQQNKNDGKITQTQNNQHNIKITVDKLFMKTFYKFIKEYKTCSYNEELSGVEIKNIKEKIFINKVSNILITINNYTIKINNPIDFHMNNYNKEIIKVGTADSTEQKEITTFTDLLTTEQKNAIDNIFNAIGNNYDEIIMRIKTRSGGTAPSNYFSADTCVDLLIKKYPKLDTKKTFIEITAVFTILTTLTLSITGIYTLLKSKNKLLFDPLQYYNIDNINSNLFWNYTLDYISMLSGTQLTELQNIFMPLQTKYNELTYATQSTNKNNGLYLDLEIIGAINDKTKSNHIIEAFIGKVLEHNIQSSKKIKIYSLTLENEKKFVEKPNPEYEGWMEKKQLLSKIESTNKDELREFIMLPIPTKTITTEIITPTITSKQLNEQNKDIETLYLRENDKTKLLTSLFQFRDKKDVLVNLGLPIKLNILLYGEPGTGKSTTIQAVGTYLQKDIYYVDLGAVKTNQELQMLFEYVNKNANGSIVVCEDIDAMTDIVLKRENKPKEFKPHDLIKNQDSPISLEFLLNILQGTLTMDDSIFIVTTNHIDYLDPAFYRDGRFDVKIELKLCDKYQINKIYNKMIGRDVEQSVLERIEEDKYSPASIIFHIKNYIFNTDMKDDEILEPFITKLK